MSGKGITATVVTVIGLMTAVGAPSVWTLVDSAVAWKKTADEERKASFAFREQYYKDFGEEIAARRARNFCSDNPDVCEAID